MCAWTSWQPRGWQAHERVAVADGRIVAVTMFYLTLTLTLILDIPQL